MEWLIGGFVLLVILGAILNQAAAMFVALALRRNITLGLLKAKNRIFVLTAIAK